MLALIDADESPQFVGTDGHDYFVWPGSEAWLALDGGAGYDTIDFTNYVNFGGPQMVSFSAIRVGASNDVIQAYYRTSMPSGQGPITPLFNAVNIERLIVGVSPVDLTGYVRDIEIEVIYSLVSVTGGSGNDRLVGREGSNVLNGGPGNNWLDGGAGEDTAVFSYAFTAATFSVENGFIVSTGPQSRDTVIRIETLRFTDISIPTANMRIGYDTSELLSGSAAGEYIFGNGGDDRITGRGGDDVLNGGDGFDIAVFSAARSQVVVAGGNDRFTVSGPDGQDTLISIEALEFTDGTYDFVAGRLAEQARRTLVGTAGADALVGGESNDSLSGGDGADTLRGGLGSDRLDGGAGFDAALYSGVVRQYTASSTTVSGGPEGGTDTLISIEEARFIDGILSFDVNGAAAQVMRLYDAALDRMPDQAGLDVHTANLRAGTMTLSVLAQAFANSAEFQARYGALSNQAFIEQLYRFTLDREGDPAGVQAWAARLDGGASRGEILASFSESGEHRDLTASALARGLWVPDAQAMIVARLYDATFDRLPDVGGLGAWTTNLRGGMSLAEINAAFAGSAEFTARYGQLSNQAFVEQLYRFTLDREGDNAGVQAWVGQLDGGLSRADLLGRFSESAEHIALTARLWEGGIRYLGASAASPADAEPAFGLTWDATDTVWSEAPDAPYVHHVQILPDRPWGEVDAWFS